MKATGPLDKMKTHLGQSVEYTLQLGTDAIAMNDLLGTKITLRHTGKISCVNCGRITKKAFGQGFCYPCFMNSAENSECIVRPELCRGHLGEGRDVEWEKSHHVQPHYVYLALSNAVKVGVTRATQVPYRWMDQGASQGILLAEVPYRQLAGVIEVELKKYLSDKTNWQRMLKNEIAADVDLKERKYAAADLLPEELKQYLCINDTITEIRYPVLRFPEKVKSVSLEKQPEISGVLTGIKGQYLLFEGGMVSNIRNQSGYEVEFETE